MPNIASLDSIRKNNTPNEQEDTNRLYVGGTTSHGGGSGLSVIAGGNRDSNSVIPNIIERARSEAENRSGEPLTEGSRVITFYSNGFTVDNGPLRDATDPQNRPFLEAIEKGIVPHELEPENRNKPVDISLIDRRGEEYEEPPPPSYTAFAGDGKTVGSSKPTSGIVISGGSEGKPVVDESKPKTTIQIRLHNGKRLRETLNLSHLVGDIQGIINSEGAGLQSYILMAGFPPKPLQDMSKTIEEAQLQGASIIQKLAN